MKKGMCCVGLLAALLLAGCAPDARLEMPIQAGGWVESDITPAALHADAYDREIFTTGSSIRIVETTKDSIALHTSTNRGDSWQYTVLSWEQLPENAQDPHFAVSEQGGVYLIASVRTKKTGVPITEERLYFWQDGWQQIPVNDLLPIELPDDVPDNLWNLHTEGENLVLCRGMNGEILRVLRTDDTMQESLVPNTGQLLTSSMIVRDGRVWGTNQNDQIFTVDAAQQSCLQQPAQGQILMDVKDGRLYGLRGKSVYVRAEKGTVWEQLLDGGNAPRMQVAASVGAVKVLDSSCLLVDTQIAMSVQHGVGRRSQLLRYDYDPHFVPPETRTLTIYSLEENPTVQQAVFQCRLDHPELEVRYEVGMQEGLEQEDVLQQLNTRLRQEDAPDVLILDGLPVDSMVEQGLLANLSSMVDTKGLYPAARAGEQGGMLWYVAGRMKLPLMLGAGYELPESLEQLAQAVESGPQLQRQSDVSNRAVLGQPPEEIAAVLLPGMRSKLLHGGQIDRAALEQFYTLVGRLCSAVGPESYWELWCGEMLEEKYGLEGIGAALGKQVIFPKDAAAKLEIFNSLSNVCNAFYTEDSGAAADLGQYYVRGIPGAEGVYLPYVLAGIPASQKENADAVIFVQTLLSHPVQQYELGDGLPVHPESLQSQWELQPMRKNLPHAENILPQLEALLAAAHIPAVPHDFDTVVTAVAAQDLAPVEAAAQVCEQMKPWLEEHR